MRLSDRENNVGFGRDCPCWTSGGWWRSFARRRRARTTNFWCQARKAYDCGMKTWGKADLKFTEIAYDIKLSISIDLSMKTLYPSLSDPLMIRVSEQKKDPSSWEKDELWLLPAPHSWHWRSRTAWHRQLHILVRSIRRDCCRIIERIWRLSAGSCLLCTVLLWEKQRPLSDIEGEKEKRNFFFKSHADPKSFIWHDFPVQCQSGLPSISTCRIDVCQTSLLLPPPPPSWFGALQESFLRLSIGLKPFWV